MGFPLPKHRTLIAHRLCLVSHKNTSEGFGLPQWKTRRGAGILQSFAESCFPLSSILNLIFVLLKPSCLTNRHLAQDVKRRAREKGANLLATSLQPRKIKSDKNTLEKMLQ